jgi:acyl-homoserine-lactone acylase
MTRSRWISVLCAAFALTACGGGGSGSESASPDQPIAVARGSTMIWDGAGVPHIYAESAESVAFAFGRAQMQAHGELLVRLYAQARGQGAEFYGEVFEAGEPFPVVMSEVDKLVRTMGFAQRASQWEAAQTPRMRAYLEAFVDGLNEQAKTQGMSEAAQRVLPLKASDVLGHTLRSLFSYISGAGVTGKDCSLIYPNEFTPLNLVGGSNGWALGPAKTANGKAMLLANPHLLWGGSHTWFEASFSSPQYEVYGATLVGLPVMRIGFNSRLGWVHTVNTQDGCDLYELKVQGDLYEFDGSMRRFEQRLEEFKVRQADGSLQSRFIRIRQAEQGPVFEKDGKSYALRVVGVQQNQTAGILEQWWDMAQASDFARFKDVVQQQRNPFHNIIYADTQGNIWSVFAGMTPVRSEGNAAFWGAPVDGTKRSLVWSAVHPIREMPQVENPAAGWVQNSNSVPWFMGPELLNPSTYPDYLSPSIAPSLREQRGIQLIQSKQKFTLDDLMVAKHDTRSLLAERVLPALIAAARASQDATALRAARTLERWNLSTDANSRGSLLFTLWAEEMDRQGGLGFATAASFAEPFSTPAGLANIETAVGVLIGVVQELDRLGVPLATSFGDAYRFRRGSGAAALDLPANGGADALGVFRTFAYVQDEDGASRAVFGDSFVALVEFGSPVKAKVINTYGNSSDPANPAYGSQLQLASQKRMRDALLTRAEVEADGVRVERFSK